MNAQEQEKQQSLPEKIIALIDECNGLQVTMSGKSEHITKFWKNIRGIKQLCQEEVNKQ